jgi:hypothetical protein
MAFGQGAADAEGVREKRGSAGVQTNGICSIPFLEYAFQTVEYRIKVTINANGTWS